MGEASTKKSDWAIPFLGRLCLIAWVCAILYEAFDFVKPVRQVCLLFGPWACVLALLNALGFLYLRRQGIFLIFLLISIPPTVHFGLILKNIVIEKKWIAPADPVHLTAPESIPTETLPEQTAAP